MTNKQVLYSLILLIGVFISAISQVLLKKSSNKTYSSVIKEYLNPLVISSYIIFFLATFLSIVAYKYIPLYLGPVLESTSYIYITIFGITIFKEKLNLKKIISLILIISGILICSLL